MLEPAPELCKVCSGPATHTCRSDDPDFVVYYTYCEEHAPCGSIPISERMKDPTYSKHFVQST